MSEVIEFNKRARIREEASVWLVRLQEGLETHQQDQLRAWLKESEQNGQELVALAEIWDELGVLTELADLFEGIPLPGQFNDQDTVVARKFTPMRIAAVCILAICLPLSILAGLYLTNLEVPGGTATNTISSQAAPVAVNNENTRFQLEYSSEIGEQKEITLADGSHATLNTDTRIEIDFTPERRIVRLSKGEAHFEVFKDPLRPLSVEAGGKAVEAIGTAFSVRRHSDTDIQVSVEEGRVAVYDLLSSSEESSSEELKVSLDAGMVLTVTDGEQLFESIEVDDMENRLAWRDGMIVINDKDLNYVIDEFSRYSNTKVLLAEKSMGEIQVAGYFRLGDVDALLVALKENFQIQHEFYEEDNTYILRQ
jgi:transmembrane sensor